MRLAILSRSAAIYSTGRLMEAARAAGWDCDVVDYAKCSVLIREGKPEVYFKGRPLEGYNAVIPRIGASLTFHGTAVVRQFEVQGVWVANSSQAIVRSRDKLRAMQILSREGIGLPITVFAKFPKDQEVDELIRAVGGPPIIIKLLEGTQGMGVMLAENYRSARSTIEAFSGVRENILIQEFIAEAAGSDIRAIVVGQRVVAAMRRLSKKGDFRSNLHRGGEAVRVDLDPDQERTALRAAKALNLQVAGVDMLPSVRGPLILEVNSSPGLKGIEYATGVDVASEIIRYCAEELTKTTENQNTDEK
ncbi:MAG: 30S ribosomal protein S6--L-glutamate ligase [Flavobacteriales bacterium]|nr:30S ribosomal protein S6--L-glutamate ligase [Flavobacteriales bacterium]